MSCGDAEGARVLLDRRVVRTSRRIAEPFEEAYQWMQQLGIKPNSSELVGTIAFTGQGKVKVCELTWAELVDLHCAYQHLKCIEPHVNAGDGQVGADTPEGERG